MSEHATAELEIQALKNGIRGAMDLIYGFLEDERANALSEHDPVYGDKLHAGAHNFLEMWRTLEAQPPQPSAGFPIAWNEWSDGYVGVRDQYDYTGGLHQIVVNRHHKGFSWCVETLGGYYGRSISDTKDEAFRTARMAMRRKMNLPPQPEAPEGEEDPLPETACEDCEDVGCADRPRCPHDKALEDKP